MMEKMRETETDLQIRVSDRSFVSSKLVGREQDDATRNISTCLC
jgi:hypothetical protein